jgi:membrane protein
MARAGQRWVGFRQLHKHLINAIERFVEDDMMTYAAAIAFQMFFSLFAFVIFLIALLGFFHIPGFFNRLLEQAQTVLPGQAAWIVEQVTGQMPEQSSKWLLFFGIIAALWAASSGVRALMHALNTAYHVEPRPTWKRYPLSIFYAIVLAVLIIVVVGSVLIDPQVMGRVADQVGVGTQIGASTIVVALWTWLRVPVALLLLMVVVALIYYLLPNADEPLRLITLGTALAAIVWVATSLGFAYYVSNFVFYSATYGPLGAVLALQIYFFISASVLLFGAEVNVEIYDQLVKDVDERKKPQEASQAGE